MMTSHKIQPQADMANLYHKKLRSLAELRQEKERLRAETSSSFNNPETGDTVFNDILPAAIDIMASKGVPAKLLAIALPMLQLAGSQVEKNILKKVAIEVLSGYAKWKGTELGMNALARLVKRKFKKAVEKED